MRLAAPLALVVLVASAPGARGDGDPARAPAVRIDRLDGESVSGRRVSVLDGKRVVLETEGTPIEVPLSDVIEIGFPTSADPPRAWTAMDVAVDLWSGEVVPGTLLGGEGDRVEIESPLVGKCTISLERIAAVRFLQQIARAAEPPDLRPSKESDHVHLSGGDGHAGTVVGFGAKGLTSRTGPKTNAEFPYERLVAVTFTSEGVTPPKRDGALRVALRDGTDLLGRDPVLDGGRLRMKSVSGFAAECALADVVALQPASDRFRFLSDVTPASTGVKPLWSVAAGDPAVLFAPRMDRSFSGRPLRCGGRSWLDGIGVFSGTTLTYDLDGKYREFRASAGLDDGAGPLGGVVFQVLVDGKEVWNSGFVVPAPARGATAPARGTPGPVATPRIPLTGAKTLSLVVLAGDATDPYPVQDEADWLGAVILRNDDGPTPPR